MVCRYLQFAPACRVVLKFDFHDQCRCKEYRSIDSVHHDNPKTHNPHHTKAHKMEGCIVMNHLAPLDGSEHCDKCYRNRYNLNDRPRSSCNFCTLKTNVSDFETFEIFHYHFTKPFHKFKVLSGVVQCYFFSKHFFCHQYIRLYLFL
jgi:hypothetical protein